MRARRKASSRRKEISSSSCLCFAMRVPPKFKFPPVGYCIYCADNFQQRLTEEHIIPYSLGGHRVLPKASCGRCATITAEIERYCCQHMFSPLRLHQNYPTRNRKERWTHLTVLDGPTPHNAPHRLAPVDLAPGIIVLPIIPPPALLLGARPTNKIENLGLAWWDTAGDSDERTRNLKRQGWSGALATVWFRLGSFLRLLAKIAHGYAASQDGFMDFHPLLPPFILGHDDRLAFLIGCDLPGQHLSAIGYPRNEPLHQISPLSTRVGPCEYLIVQIRLFATLRPLAPIYTVVTGRRTHRA